MLLHTTQPCHRDPSVSLLFGSYHDPYRATNPFAIVVPLSPGEGGDWDLVIGVGNSLLDCDAAHHEVRRG